jgi:hypothetical protein
MTAAIFGYRDNGRPYTAEEYAVLQESAQVLAYTIGLRVVKRAR